MHVEGGVEKTHQNTDINSVIRLLNHARLAYPSPVSRARQTYCHTDFANKDRGHAMGSCPGLTEFLNEHVGIQCILLGLQEIV